MKLTLDQLAACVLGGFIIIALIGAWIEGVGLRDIYQWMVDVIDTMARWLNSPVRFARARKLRKAEETRQAEIARKAAEKEAVERYYRERRQARELSTKEWETAWKEADPTPQPSPFLSANEHRLIWGVKSHRTKGGVIHGYHAKSYF